MFLPQELPPETYPGQNQVPGTYPTKIPDDRHKHILVISKIKTTEGN